MYAGTTLNGLIYNGTDEVLSDLDDTFHDSNILTSSYNGKYSQLSSLAPNFFALNVSSFASKK